MRYILHVGDEDNTLFVSVSGDNVRIQINEAEEVPITRDEAEAILDKEIPQAE